MLRRRRGLGLLGAAVGGANAAGNSAVRSIAGEASQAQQLANLQDPGSSAADRPVTPAFRAPPSGSNMDAKIAQLQELGKLRAVGVLTVEEFAAQKAHILAS